MRQYQPEPRSYELMTILSPEVPDDDIQGQLDAIAGYVSNAGGAVVDVNRESPWGRRRLAYAIRHQGRDVRDGFYTVFHVRLDPTRVVEVERDIKLNDQIIRHLITQHEPKPVEATEGQPEAAAQPDETPVAPAEATPARRGRAAAARSEPAAAVVAPEVVAPGAIAPEAAPEPAAPEAVDLEATAAEPAAPAATVPAAEEAAEAPSEASDSQPQVATAAGTEEAVTESPATTPGEEPENPPAQPDPTPEEE